MPQEKDPFEEIFALPQDRQAAIWANMPAETQNEYRDFLRHKAGLQPTRPQPAELLPKPPAPPPETVSERVRRYGQGAMDVGRDIARTVRPYFPENPVRTGFGIAGGILGSTAALPSWLTGPAAIPAEFLAGGAGYTGGTHVYDLITGSMPGGARTPGEYAAATIPGEFVTGGVQESLGPAMSALARTKLINPLLAPAEKKISEMTADELATETAKKLGPAAIASLAHLAGLGKEGGKYATDILAGLLAVPAVRDRVVYLVNHGLTDEAVNILQGEIVRRGLTSGGPTMTGLPPGATGAEQVRPIPPTSRAEALERLRQVRGLWSQQQDLLPTSTNLIRPR